MTAYHAIHAALEQSCGPTLKGIEAVALVVKFGNRRITLEPGPGSSWTARCELNYPRPLDGVEGSGQSPEEAIRACADAANEASTVCHIGSDAGGTYVEWFDEHAYAVPMGARWYGTHGDCLVRLMQPAPTLHPWRTSDRGSDAATATGMYDQEGGG